MWRWVALVCAAVSGCQPTPGPGPAPPPAPAPTTAPVPAATAAPQASKRAYSLHCGARDCAGGEICCVSDSDTYSCVASDPELPEHVRGGSGDKVFKDYNNAYGNACKGALGKSSKTPADTLAFRTCNSSADCPSDEGCCELNAVSELADAPTLDICTELVGGQCPTQELCVDSQPGCRGKGMVCVFGSCVRKDRPVHCGGRICSGGARCCDVAQLKGGGSSPGCVRPGKCPSGSGIACSGSAECADGFECRGLVGSTCRRVGIPVGSVPVDTLCESDADCARTSCSEGVPMCDHEPQLAKCSCGDRPLSACRPSTRDGARCTLKGSSAAGHCHKSKCLDDSHCRAVCEAAAAKAKAECKGGLGCVESFSETRKACLAQLCKLASD